MSRNSSSPPIDAPHFSRSKIDECECRSCEFIFKTLTEDNALKFNDIIRKLQGNASWVIYNIITSLLKQVISYRSTKCINILIHISVSTFRESLKEKILDAIIKNNAFIRLQIIEASIINDIYMMKKLVFLFISSNDMNNFLRYIILCSSSFRDTVNAITNDSSNNPDTGYEFMLTEKFLHHASAYSLRRNSIYLKSLCNLSSVIPSIVVFFLTRNLVFDMEEKDIIFERRRVFMYIYSKNLVLPDMSQSILNVCSDRYLLSNIFKYLDYY